jgi:hypothetical protein
MPSQRPAFQQMGFLRKDGGGDDWTIPIYGIEEMSFNHESTFDITTSINAPQIIQWKGDKPVQFSFKFKLVAGVTAVSRKKLFSYVKIAHALNAGTYSPDGRGIAKPPPPCQFALGDYVLCRGLLLSIRCDVQGPWASDEGDSEDGLVSMNPTAAVFSGEFLAANGVASEWETTATQIVQRDIKRLSSSDVKNNFYRT